MRSFTIGDVALLGQTPRSFTAAWPGSNGDPWPSPWTFAGTSGFSATQNGSGAGIITPPASISDHAYGYPSSLSLVDVDVTARVSASAPGYQTRFTLRWDGTIAAGNPANCYLVLNRPGRNSGVYVVNGAGSTTLLTSLTNVSGDYRWRLQAQGTALRVKRWASAGSEPGSWTWTGTDSTLTAAGRVGVGVLRSSPGGALPVFSEFAAVQL